MTPSETRELELSRIRHNRQLMMRMQKMYEWMQPYHWKNFYAKHPDAKNWFNENGEPT